MEAFKLVKRNHIYIIVCMTCRAYVLQGDSKAQTMLLETNASLHLKTRATQIGPERLHYIPQFPQFGNLATFHTSQAL